MSSGPIIVAKGKPRHEATLKTIRDTHLKSCETGVKQGAQAARAMIEARKAHILNTAELANILLLGAERPAIRQRWLRRLSKNPLLSGPTTFGTVGAPRSFRRKPSLVIQRMALKVTPTITHPRTAYTVANSTPRSTTAMPVAPACPGRFEDGRRDYLSTAIRPGNTPFSLA